MTIHQLFGIALGTGALLYLIIRQHVLVVGLTTVGLTLYEVIAIFNAPYTGGGASMWPIAAFVVAIVSAAGSALGVFLISIALKNKD